MQKQIIHRFTLAILSISFIFLSTNVKSQVNVQDSTISSFVLYAAYAFQFPGGDMADRYGYNSTIGPGVIYKTAKNWTYTLEMNFIFGNKTKNPELIIQDLLTPEGNLIGLDGLMNPLYVKVRPLERGFTLFGKIGKIIPAFNINPNSGFFFNAGMGYIQHQIKWDVEGNNSPQLGGDYKKGYDRFTEGFSLTQSFGLFYMADTRIWNFSVSAEIIEAFTKTKRYNFDTQAGEPNSRLDMFYGLKVKWMIPLFGRAPKAIYYY